MLAYIFIVEGVGKIAGYASVTDYMQAHGIDGRLLPLVILTELGGGLPLLFGWKARWAAIALSGYCLLTALFFHFGADQTIHFQKNIAWRGAFSRWRFSARAHGRCTPGALAPARVARQPHRNPIRPPTSPRSLVEATDSSSLSPT